MSLQLRDANGVVWDITITINGELQASVSTATLPAAPSTLSSGAMSREDIINLVDSLTERRASKQLDLKKIFNLRLQKFSQEARFWWRAATANFNTVAGQQDYDLSTIAADWDELVAIQYVASTTDVRVLTPIFEPGVIRALDIDTTQGLPTQYFIKPSAAPTSVSLYFTPDRAYSLVLSYWAIPTMDDTSEVIPYVPGNLHHVLISGLKMDVFEFIFGPESQKYLIAAKEYQDGVAKAMAKHTWSTQRVMRFTGESSPFSIRSTNGN